MIDGFPLGLTVVGIALHLLYGSLLTTFPVISLCSIGFIGGTGERHYQATFWYMYLLFACYM